MHRQHLPVLLRTFRDIHVSNRANIRVVDFESIMGCHRLNIRRNWLMNGSA